MDVNFKNAFAALTGNEPFPWQEALFERFISSQPDNIPSSCNLPTGLGKTSVIAIWLLARQVNRSLPRRLAYVVNRRTVVDQTTNEVTRYKKKIPSDLAVSTLRGEFMDNREWSTDPSREAVICGTVDMIGSRLLFSGYGIGFKSRPLHAGFLGQDTLIVHDEAHLEPAFQELLLAIQREQHSGRFPDRFPLRVMELTATPRGEGEVFGLTEEEKHVDFERKNVPEPLRVVWRRTHAKKALRLHKESSGLPDELAGLALKYESSGCAILVFVRSVDDLEKTFSLLPRDRTQRLTGTMRGFERDGLLLHPVFARFLPQSSRPENILPTEGTVYLVCTSAGEVGVNISADHLVCDLSTFESMAQRFGRVNRFGLRDDTRIDIVYPEKFDDNILAPARRKTLELLGSLDDASPAALSKLDPAARLSAFAPQPDTPQTSDILFDVWSMTSVRGRMPGRPSVEPYLRGIRNWEPAQTKIGWRSEVNEITEKRLEEYPPEDLLELYPIKSYELLTDRSDRVFSKLKKLAPAKDLPIWIVDDEGNVEKVTSWARLVEGDKKPIEGKILLLPPQLGGLESGFFTAAKYDERESYDVADEWRAGDKPMRTRCRSDDKGLEPKTPVDMKSVARIVLTSPEDEDEDETPIKTWHWYVRLEAADADTQSRQNYALQPHLNDTKEAAERLVAELPLEPELCDAIVLAAAYHDVGKDRERWQNSIGNRDYPDIKWAKSAKYAASGERSYYRHEFGSILDMQDEPSFRRLSDDAKDLVLHLIAAHHGRARPHFNSRECLDDKYPTEAARAQAIEASRRFARLQRKFGRWGLAYLESLVRTADYKASAIAEESRK
jgi:CRISPR-associated endonuclease/helicase Cas3